MIRPSHIFAGFYNSTECSLHPLLLLGPNLDGRLSAGTQLACQPPPDPTSHKRALPATPSVVTKSVKRARTNRMLCQLASPCPDSAPCTVRPWGRLVFSIGKNIASMRTLKRRTRFNHTKLRAQDSAVHLPSSPQRSTAPHTVPPPPASHTSGCTTTAPAQTSMERVCLDT